MQIRWEDDEARNVAFFDVPEMQVLSFAERKMQVCEDDDNLPKNSTNRMKMAGTIAKHTYLVLKVEHDVHVAQTEEVTGRMKRGSGGLVRTQMLSRVFNLLDIACKLVAVNCGMGAHGPPTALLSCHPNSFPCAFTVSQFLRELCDQFVVEFNQNGVSWVADDSNLNKQPARGIRLSDLLPSQS